MEGTADEGAPRSAMRWRPARLLLAVAAARWLATPRPLHAQEPDLVPFAQAYTAAWNAHDLDGVLAFFAPDAVVRARWGDVPPAVWDSRDPKVAHAYLAGAGTGDHDNPGGLVWASGPPALATWAAARFAQGRRAAAGQYCTAGGTVAWQYQQFSGPY